MEILSAMENNRKLQEIKQISKQIESLKDKFSSFSDAEMKNQTEIFRSRLYSGESLNSILPEAFALVAVATEKIFGYSHYPVQFLGGIALHQGRVAEMKTGEGKTLTIALSAYLNALSGQPVHVMTSNDYLAKRDSEEMSKIYEFLGLSTNFVDSSMSENQKRKAYSADITYGTVSTFGFDYLKDNLIFDENQKVMRGLGFAIIDEADSILLDQANTPLIISGDASLSEDSLFNIRQATEFVSKLGLEYVEIDKERKKTYLSEKGLLLAESALKLKNATTESYMNALDYINSALTARFSYEKDKNYFVQDGKIILVDSKTGRPLPSHKYEDGIQHAIESKEGLEITPETKTQGTITIQNFLRKYRKISGTSGTIKSSEDELEEIYNLDVVQIPTNKPVARIDREDQIFICKSDKYDAIIEEIEESHKKGQPVLVGTSSIAESETLSKMLDSAGIKHNVLNAKSLEREAEIIALAGTFGAVTIATDMAGRGTDIRLGGNAESFAKLKLLGDGVPFDLIEEVSSTKQLSDEKLLKLRDYFEKLKSGYETEVSSNRKKVIDAGGLKVIGTERRKSIRIDNQLRGRAGRQGEIGESVFFSSAEDDMIAGNIDSKLYRMFNSHFIYPTDKVKTKIIEQINKIQKIEESIEFSSRKSMVKYDAEIDRERNCFYDTREKVLAIESVYDLINIGVQSIVFDYAKMCYDNQGENIDVDALNKNIKSIFDGIADAMPKIEIADFYERRLLDWHVRDYAEKVAQSYDVSRQVLSKQTKNDIDIDFYEKVLLLKIMDRSFMDHIKACQTMQKFINLQAYAGNNPLQICESEEHFMFDKMMHQILQDFVFALFDKVLSEKQKENIDGLQAEKI